MSCVVCNSVVLSQVQCTCPCTGLLPASHGEGARDEDLVRCRGQPNRQLAQGSTIQVASSGVNYAGSQLRGQLYRQLALGSILQVASIGVNYTGSQLRGQPYRQLAQGSTLQEASLGVNLTGFEQFRGQPYRRKRLVNVM